MLRKIPCNTGVMSASPASASIGRACGERPVSALGVGRSERPRPAIEPDLQCRSAASPDRSFVHRAAFSAADKGAGNARLRLSGSFGAICPTQGRRSKVLGLLRQNSRLPLPTQAAEPVRKRRWPDNFAEQAITAGIVIFVLTLILVLLLAPVSSIF